MKHQKLFEKVDKYKFVEVNGRLKRPAKKRKHNKSVMVAPTHNIPLPEPILSENPLEYVEISDALASHEASGTITKGTCNSPKVGHNIKEM